MGTISVHIHPPIEEFLRGRQAMMAQMAGSLGPEGRRQQVRPLEDVIGDMDAAGIEKSVIFSIDGRASGMKNVVANDTVAQVVARHPDRLIGFCSVDPHMGAEAVRELERSIKELRLQGLKLDPTKQDFCPTDRWVYPIYEKCVDLDIPITTHGGWSPGFKMEYGNPVYWDNIAHDFPDLRVNIAHFAWPWAEECVAVVWNRKNVYFDINGWRPAYIPPRVVHFMNTTVQNKVLFSHDFPVTDGVTMVREFEELGLKPEVARKIREDNPRRFLGL